MRHILTTLLISINLFLNAQADSLALKNINLSWAISSDPDRRLIVRGDGYQGNYDEWVAPNTYYVAPTGSDNNTGSLSSPFASLNKAWTVIQPGDSVFMRGGTYSFTTQQYLINKNGAAGKVIFVGAYKNEQPVLSKGTTYAVSYYRGGCYFSGNYFHFKGLEITGFVSTGDTYVWNGLLCINSSYNTFENLKVHHNGGGLYIQGASTGNLVLNSDFYFNYDLYTAGHNADGLDIAYVSSGTSNIVRGCRAWNNSDDGFDAWENEGFVQYENCSAFKNGTDGGDGNGFKLGRTLNVTTSVGRRLINCLSYNNRANGFDQNQAICKIEIFNSVAYNNGGWGFFMNWGTSANTFKNNISYANYNGNVITTTSAISSNNAYGGSGYSEPAWANIVTDADFLSVNADNGSFLRLASGSDLIDKGTNVGILFNGAAPDIGAFETGGSVIVIPPPPPVTVYDTIILYRENGKWKIKS